MEYSEYDFKFAKTILHEIEMLREIDSILREANIKLGRNVSPSPSRALIELFEINNWVREYSVTDRSSRLRFDLFKNNVAIEIQLTDPSDCYNDYLKFLLAYNHERIEVGVEIVYDNTVRGSSLPYINRVINDLEIYRRVIPCPIWVIGLKE